MTGTGQRRERQAAEYLQRAGWETYRPERAQFGDNDVFGLFDLLAIRDGELLMIQVKGRKDGHAAGIEAWGDAVEPFAAVPGVTPLYFVCHTRRGWRVLDRDGAVLCDGRESDANMGEDVVRYFEGDR